MFYLVIAIGGAFGSIARAWMAIAVARITGPQFPWGTILINILGSFVIGFFSSLTTTEGRFPVSADFRAFVMIGICGGFTTFSSFSLQTLDLIRDGRPLQALGNIGLSVVLCITAVAAGYYGATPFNRIQAAAAMPASTAPGQVIVAVLSNPPRAESLLDSAVGLLQHAGGGRLKAVAIRMPPAAAIMPSEEVLSADGEAAIRAEQEHWAAQLREMVSARATRAEARGIHTDWVDTEGDAAAILADLGRRADAIVVARPADHEPERMRSALHAALFDTETPVLVVPPNHDGPIGTNIAIAWKNDAQAEKSVHAALPLLRKAQQIHILSADGPAEAPAILQEHGIQATLSDVPDGPASTAQRLLQAAHQIGADLLVMGAYAHGEWREMVFGGVTRTMLTEADLPLFLRH
jgi:protein CrcB